MTVTTPPPARRPPAGAGRTRCAARACRCAGIGLAALLVASYTILFIRRLARAPAAIHREYVEAAAAAASPAPRDFSDDDVKIIPISSLDVDDGASAAAAAANATLNGSALDPGDDGAGGALLSGTLWDAFAFPELAALVREGSEWVGGALRRGGDADADGSGEEAGDEEEEGAEGGDAAGVGGAPANGTAADDGGGEEEEPEDGATAADPEADADVAAAAVAAPEGGAATAAATAAAAAAASGGSGGLMCDPDARYLLLLNGRQKLPAWFHAVAEAALMAKHLGRTLVLPCVAGGQMVPCTPGKVIPVPESPESTDHPISAFDDPLHVPAYRDYCASSAQAQAQAESAAPAGAASGGTGDAGSKGAAVPAPAGGAAAAAGGASGPRPPRGRVLLEDAADGGGGGKTAGAAAVAKPVADASGAVAAAAPLGGNASASSEGDDNNNDDDDVSSPVIQEGPVELERSGGRAYPASLYLSLPELRAKFYANIIHFDEWLRCQAKATEADIAAATAAAAAAAALLPAGGARDKQARQQHVPARLQQQLAAAASLQKPHKQHAGGAPPRGRGLLEVGGGKGGARRARKFAGGSGGGAAGGRGAGGRKKRSHLGGGAAGGGAGHGGGGGGGVGATAPRPPAPDVVVVAKPDGGYRLEVELAYCVLPDVHCGATRLGRFTLRNVWTPTAGFTAAGSHASKLTAAPVSTGLGGGLAGGAGLPGAAAAAGGATAASAAGAAGVGGMPPAYLWRQHRQLLEGDTRRNMVLFNAASGFWRPAGTFDVASPALFNQIHQQAVTSWVLSKLSAPAPFAYAVFHWRRSSAGFKDLQRCATRLKGYAGPVVAAVRASRYGSAVLLADVSAPERPCHTGPTTLRAEQRGALLHTLGGAGLVKYDSDHPGIDGGVLTLREYLLAVNSRWYVTCHDPNRAASCRGCFAAKAKSVAAILAARRAAGRVSFRRWWGLSPQAVLAGAPSAAEEAAAAAAEAAEGGEDGSWEEDETDGAAAAGGATGDGSAAALAAGVPAAPPPPAAGQQQQQPALRRTGRAGGGANKAAPPR